MSGIEPESLSESSGFLRKSTLGVAIAALLILTPFSINNFLHGRYLLGAGSLAIVIIIAINALQSSRGHYSSLFNLVVLFPAIVFFLLLAIYRQGIIGILWCYPAILSFYMMLPERKAWIANISLLVFAFPLAWNVLEYPLAARVTGTLLAVSIFSAVFIRIITSQQQQLHEHAIKDPLTGLFNRTLLQPLLEQASQQNKRNSTPMTLVSVDIDHFKSINDKYGHDTGDRVLQCIGKLIRERVRSVDKVFRLGGEEFLALLFDTDAGNAINVADELRKSLESRELIANHPVTISIGLATLQPGEDLEQWIKRSDENLYRAKINGRNCVVA